AKKTRRATRKRMNSSTVDEPLLHSGPPPETPGTSGSHTLSNETPRRSCRKSVRPPIDYDDIVRSAKKLMTDEADAPEEGQQPAAQKWSVAEVGKSARKRGRKSKRLTGKRQKTEQIEPESAGIDSGVKDSEVPIEQPGDKLKHLEDAKEMQPENELEQSEGEEMQPEGNEVLPDAQDESQAGDVVDQSEMPDSESKNKAGSRKSSRIARKASTLKKKRKYNHIVGDEDIDELGLSPIDADSEGDEEELLSFEEMVSLAMPSPEQVVHKVHEDNDLDFGEIKTVPLSPIDFDEEVLPPLIFDGECNENQDVDDDKDCLDFGERKLLNMSDDDNNNYEAEESSRNTFFNIKAKKSPLKTLFDDEAEKSPRNTTFDVDDVNQEDQSVILLDSPVAQSVNKAQKTSIKVVLTTTEGENKTLLNPKRASQKPVATKVNLSDSPGPSGSNQNKLEAKPIYGRRRSKSASQLNDAKPRTVTFRKTPIEIISVVETDNRLKEEATNTNNVTKRRRRSKSLDERRDFTSRLPKPRIQPLPKPRPLTPSDVKKRTKLPDFSALHQKEFAKMESLVDHVERKAERAKILTSSALKKPLGSTAKQSQSSTSAAEQAQGSRPKASKKIDMAADRTVVAENPAKKLPPSRLPLKSAQNSAQNVTAVPQPAFNLSTATAKTFNVTLSSKPSGSQTDKLAERRQRHQDMFKGRAAAKAPEKKSEFIRGVRLNRRFELQMQHRKHLEED
ncbi:hypothetical protein KR054_005480, partial [Drosophila jambulina]